MSLRIALALGSGGARGYAHIGVIHELTARGHEIVSVSGSSMGAVVGGAFAAGKLDAYADWVRGLSHRAVVQHLDVTLGSGGLLRAERVLTRMVEVIGDHRIEQLPVRFTAVAVDLLASREVWLDSGSLDRAIRASIGMPGLFTPTIVNGRLLVDGGVLNPVPVAATASVHADAVVAVSLQGPRTRRDTAIPVTESADRRPMSEWWDRFRANATGLVGADVLTSVAQRLASRRPGGPADTGELNVESLPSLGMLEVLSLSLDASQAALTRYALAAHTPDVLIQVPKDICHARDFHRAAEVIDAGRAIARQALDQARIN
jgi:NTE family protein